MAGSSNFLQVNPTQSNQESDATYLADAQRLGGFQLNQIFPSELGNKIFYQVSTFITALASALAAKGYSVQDTNISVLQAVVANILTQADCPLAIALGGTGATTLAGAGILTTANLPLPIASGGIGTTSFLAAGLASRVYLNDLTGVTGTIGVTTMITPASPGFFIIFWESNFSAAVANTATFEFFWTQNGVAHVINNLIGSQSTDNKSISGMVVVYSDASQPIQFAQSVNFGSSYDFHVRIVQV